MERACKNLRRKILPTPEAFYEKLKTDASAQLLEDYVVQHPELSALYPYSVNTLRIMTLIKGETIHIIASIRIGNGGKVVDNINNGGMVNPNQPGNRRTDVPSLRHGWQAV